MNFCYRNLDHSVKFVFDYAIGFFNFVLWKTVCDEWGSINFALFYQVKIFGTIATIITAGFEREIFAIHIG